MLFELSDHLNKSQVQGIDVPSKHKFAMSDIWQTFGVFSETPCGTVIIENFLLSTPTSNNILLTLA